MDRPATGTFARWRDRTSLTLLLLLATVLHGWLFCHTEVTARDSIGYIRYAWQLQQRPWRDVMRSAEQHPGYPFVILGVSLVVQPCMTGPRAVVMQRSAQLASTLAAILLVVPMFYLGRELFNRPTAFWASLLFQFLPASSRVLSDGLSEATFLLLAATALWLALRALRTGSALGFGLCGLFGGLAYLTRPEGALLVGVTGLVLLGAQAVPAWRRPWPRCLVGGASLGIAALLIGGPFVALTGQITVKPTPKTILQTAEDAQGPARPLLAWTLAVWSPGATEQLGWGARSVGFELVKGFQYVGWLPALLGLWWGRGRFRRRPGPWVLALVGVIVTVLLWRVATVMGYVSDRHVLLVLLCGSYWTVAGVREAPRRLAGLAPRLPAGFLRARCTQLAEAGLAPTLLLALLVASGVPKCLETLHGDRGGFREAGLWLAEHATTRDRILDPYCWSHYYAGRVFLEGTPTGTQPGHVPVEYVVLERSSNPHPRLTLVGEAEALSKLGRVVYRWQGQRRRDQAEVIVYEVPLTARTNASR